MSFSLLDTFNANPVEFSEHLHKELLNTKDVCERNPENQAAMHFVNATTGNLDLEIGVQWMPNKRLCLSNETHDKPISWLLSDKFGLGEDAVELFDVILDAISTVFDIPFDGVVMRIKLDSVLVATGSYMFLFMRHGSKCLN